MSDTKELTYSDVAEHNTKKDLYVVVHDKVYNASSFVDEHPYVSSSYLPIPDPSLPLSTFSDLLNHLPHTHKVA